MQTDIKSILSRVAVGLFILVIALYALYQARGVLSGPQIKVFQPENGTTTTSSLLTVEGEALRAKEITLNGRPIFIDLEGRFFERLLLQNGYNIIELKATDAQRETKTTLIEVVYRKE